jgi:hypothetical protein
MYVILPLVGHCTVGDSTSTSDAGNMMSLYSGQKHVFTHTVQQQGENGVILAHKKTLTALIALR